MAEVRQLDELAPDYGDVLAGLATVLQQVAVAQVAGSQALESDGGTEGDLSLVIRLAEAMTPETVQLMYQIAVMGRRDLALAPDPRTGFEMALLRMVAFHPERNLPAVTPASTGASAGPLVARPAARPVPADPAVSATSSTPSGRTTSIGDWSVFIDSLNIDGAARQLAAHCALVAQSPFEICLTLDKRNGHLLTDKLRGRLTAALHERLGSAIKVLLTIAEVTPDGNPDTPAARQARSDDDDLRRARAKLAADSNVQQMAELFGAEVIPESIRQNPKSPSRK
jgi:DNA polymerase-3 subunit gamma/tau